MCVAFSPYTIYSYAFSHDDGLEDVARLRKKDIATFCSVLNRDLTKRLARRIPHRSVYFATGQDDIDSFFWEYRDEFLDFGDEVVHIGDNPRHDAKWFESKYADDDVTASLRKARKVIRNVKKQQLCT